MDDFDDYDYDYESILETLEPVYRLEGDIGARDLLMENGFPQPMIDELLHILWQLHHRGSTSYFDD